MIMASWKLAPLQGNLVNAKPDSNSDWWKVFHVPEMADLFLVRSDPDELRATLDFFREELRLTANDHLYDQCCGIGSLSIALQGGGFRVTGADLCDFFIERAKQDAEVAQADCHFQCADAFVYTPDSPCQGVFNWYSSFGYARTDEQNRLMFQRAFDSLVPGGRFALDVPNLPGLIRGFQRHIVRRGESAGKSVTLIRESTLNLVDGQLEQTWTWLTEGQPPVDRQSRLRLYLPHQIREMLESVGFKDVRFFSDVDKAPLTIDSGRLICVCER